MEIATAISLLTINLIVLSVVIVLMIIALTVLVVKLNKIASNVQHTSENIANATAWLSPMKVFSELAKAFKSFKNR